VVANVSGGSTPEPARDLQISDQEWLLTLYPQLSREPNWLLEFRFLEDRSDGLKSPPVAVRFYRDVKEMAFHLKAHRELAAQRAKDLRQSNTGPWPAGLFWGVQPRLTRRGRKEHVAAFVALTCDLDCKDWPELAEGERPRAVWSLLHCAAPSPSMVAWTGHGFHAYWLLREPWLDKPRGEEVQKAIARCLRGDHVADCSRLLRWPNSVNYKGVLRNQSRTVRLVWWRPELRYAFNTLAEHFMPYLYARPPACGKNSDLRPLWKRFHGCLDDDSDLKALWEGQTTGLSTHDRSALDMALAHALVRHQFAYENFSQIAPLAKWNAEKTLELSYLQRTWRKAEARRLPVVQPPECTLPSSNPAPIIPVLDAATNLFLSELPDSSWTPWSRLYRGAVGSSTEAADEFHYVALLTVLGAALGRTVSVSCGRPLHPNIYAMLIGPSGDRKSTAAEMAMNLLRRVAPDVSLLNGVGSQEGLMERMAGADTGQGLHCRTLLFVDEVAALLKKGRRESSGSLLEFITEIFHSPDFKTHFTRSKAIHLDNPTLSILSASTPAWLEAALEEEDILGGFANRFIYVSAAPKPDNPLPVLPDADKLQSLCGWIQEVARSRPRVMGWAPGAEELWRDFYLEWRRFLTAQNERTATILRRIDLYILKFACINAAMDDAGQISHLHLTAAIDLGRYLGSCSHNILSDLAGQKDCRLERLIEQKLQSAEGVMKRKHLRRVLGGRITGEKLDRILRAMERNGIIRQIEEPTARGPSRSVQLAPHD
jgi:hypothetical protein